jgi:hypothetical protein
MIEPRSVSSSRCALYAALVVFVVMFAFVPPSATQVTPPVYYSQMRPPASQPTFDTPAQPGDPDSVAQERQMRALNAERQKSMVSDTNKLLKLVTELNAEVSNANSDMLSTDQLRKLAQIEKLAHSVKDKMSTSVRVTPSYQPPTPPPFR